MIPRRSLFALLLLTSNAFAHDFWIEPARYRTESGERIPLTIKVGYANDVSILNWNSKHVETCFLSDGAQRKTITNRDGALPAAAIRPTTPGLYTFAYGSHATRLELEAKKFEAYLKEEGLDSILAERKKLGETEKLGRELFARCTKSLIRVGGEKANEEALKPVGLTLEIVLDEDPTLPRKSGQALTGRLLLRGEPQAKFMIRAVRLDESHFTRAVYTDEKGRFGFTFEPGPVMLAAVAMERAPDGDPDSSNAEWKSSWATLTFEVAEALLESKVEPQPVVKVEENR